MLFGLKNALFDFQKIIQNIFVDIPFIYIYFQKIIKDIFVNLPFLYIDMFQRFKKTLKQFKAILLEIL
jgi:hypothetical protein